MNRRVAQTSRRLPCRRRATSTHLSGAAAQRTAWPAEWHPVLNRMAILKLLRSAPVSMNHTAYTLRELFSRLRSGLCLSPFRIAPSSPNNPRSSPIWSALSACAESLESRLSAGARQRPLWLPPERSPNASAAAPVVRCPRCTGCSLLHPGFPPSVGGLPAAYSSRNITLSSRCQCPSVNVGVECPGRHLQLVWCHHRCDRMSVIVSISSALSR